MTLINIENFNEKYPEIEKSIQQAKFIGVDLEFSALHPVKAPSLFDNPRERYSKLRANLSQITPIQIGISTFSFDPNNISYCGKIYNFYILPAAFPTVHRSFYFQSDTLNFLKLYNFDFNEFVYLGIPFLNRQQEDALRLKLKSGDINENQICCKAELESLINSLNDVVTRWYNEAAEGDQLPLPEIFDKYEYNFEMLYFIHKHFRRRLQHVWTAVENNEFVLKRVSEKEYRSLEKTDNLEEAIITDLLGFTKVFRLITSLRIPIVGHNLLQDILLMISSFETSLPQSYAEFKKLANGLFPSIFDTKTISYELKHMIPEEKIWADSSLESLFDYFKNGSGRHLVLNSPAVLLERDGNYGKFHEAGWDAYCAGYIFIRLAYLNVYHKFPKSKTFMSSELIGGLSHLKNRVNVIRGAVSSIKLDGEDPASTRPPFLVIESIRNKPVDISEVTSILSSFGFVEVRKFPYHRKRALIAVDNFYSAKRILANFKSHKEFQVKQYSAIKHSPFTQAILLSGITMSGAILFWFTQRYKTL
ncbi:hypothetical protein NQ315_010703 [Exocentrus adspersus]|uniref:Pre-piRNA 3'-exonuclease trimmer-like n=1 Tax=Exocentrus adspersus TaxID=1586481 RepID=A0AAV8VUX3_9CUCU|nr:hypothetical protein NQ315_010703 [Exocentrus adspersus]